MAKAKKTSKRASVLKANIVRRRKFAMIRKEIRQAFDKFFDHTDELSDFRLRREASRILKIAASASKKAKKVI